MHKKHTKGAVTGGRNGPAPGGGRIRGREGARFRTWAHDAVSVGWRGAAMEGRRRHRDASM